MKPKNVNVARKNLADPRYRPQTIRPKKGRGSYRRTKQEE